LIVTQNKYDTNFNFRSLPSGRDNKFKPIFA
jgi:hypothetical protein